MSNFMKIRLVGTDLFHADRPTDMTKLAVAFLHFFSNTPKSRRATTKTLALGAP